MKELWLIWKQPVTRRRYKVGLLSFNGDEYIFRYIDPELNDTLGVGFKYFPGFEDLNKVYHHKKLFVNIDTRLPNKSRPDYADILESY